MNNQPKELFNSNYTFVKNNETYNQKLFDRNFLSSQMAQIPKDAGKEYLTKNLNYNILNNI